MKPVRARMGICGSRERRRARLLLETMNDMAHTAIAKATMRQREHTVVIRPFRKGLILHTLYYPSEIHEAKGYGQATVKTLGKHEIGLAGQFAKALVKPFRPEQFHDEYAHRVEQLVESKNKRTAGARPEKLRAWLQRLIVCPPQKEPGSEAAIGSAANPEAAKDRMMSPTARPGERQRRASSRANVLQMPGRPHRTVPGLSFDAVTSFIKQTRSALIWSVRDTSAFPGAQSYAL